jgi:hypothetical protein
MLAFLLVVLNGINLTNFTRHAKIGNFTNAHFVDQHVLQLDISMNVTHGMDVLKTSDDLPEHHACVIGRESGAAVALEDIVQGAGGAILSDEVIGVGRVNGFEQRQDVFVMEWRPDLGLVIQALCFCFRIWLGGYIRTTYDLYCDDISGGGSSGANGGETAAADDGTKRITGYGLTLIVREDERSVDDWAEGGEEVSGRGRGNVAHGEGRGEVVERVGVGEGSSWVEGVWGEEWTVERVDIDEDAKT